MPGLEPGIALVLLAAGRSERFGGQKLLASYRGRPLWEWSAIAAEAAGFERLYLVLGTHSAIPHRPGWNRVVNPDSAQGMGTSIAAGVTAAAASSRIVIALADMPLVTPSHLRKLARANGTVFTRYSEGAAGAPAGFSPQVYEELRSLRGDAGARSLALPDIGLIDPPADTLLLDVDTRQDISEQAARPRP